MLRSCSLGSETTPAEILLSSGFVAPPSPPHDAMPKRRKGQHKRTWQRNSLKALYNSMAMQAPAVSGTNLDVHSALCMQVSQLQRQLCERDLELMLLRDTVAKLIERKSAH